MTDNRQRREESMTQLNKELKSRDRKEKTKPLTVVAASIAVIVVVVGGIWFAATRDSDETITADETTSPSEPAEPVDVQPLAMQRETPLGDTVECSYEEAGEASREVSLPTTTDVPATGTVTVTLATSQGDIGMELDREVAPCTVNAVEHMASEGYYDDTVCHRMTSAGLFVLQCGDPSGSGAGGPGFQFANEYPTDELEEAETFNQVIYPRGSIAMANAGVDTNGSQFFLNYEDSPLAAQYTYFGQIDEAGLETLDAIAAIGVEGGGGDGAPSEEVRITSATVS